MIGNQHTAQRIINAENSFTETVQRISGCTENDALQVMLYYLKHKLAKLDPIGGSITVKNGAYLEPDVIQRAIDMANNPP